jgi:hypothetical protein
MIWKKKRLQVTWPDEIDPDSHFAMASMAGSISIAAIIIAMALAVSLLPIIGGVFTSGKRGPQSI